MIKALVEIEGASHHGGAFELGEFDLHGGEVPSITCASSRYACIHLRVCPACNPGFHVSEPDFCPYSVHHRCDGEAPTLKWVKSLIWVLGKKVCLGVEKLSRPRAALFNEIKDLCQYVKCLDGQELKVIVSPKI